MNDIKIYYNSKENIDNDIKAIFKKNIDKIRKEGINILNISPIIGKQEKEKNVDEVDIDEVDIDEVDIDEVDFDVSELGQDLDPKERAKAEKEYNEMLSKFNELETKLSQGSSKSDMEKTKIYNKEVMTTFGNFASKYSKNSYNNGSTNKKSEKKQKNIVTIDKNIEKMLGDYLNPDLLLSLSKYNNSMFINNFLYKLHSCQYEAVIKRDIINIDKTILKAPPLIKQIGEDKIVTGRLVGSNGILNKSDLFSKFPIFYDPAYISTSMDSDYSVSNIKIDRNEREVIDSIMYLIITNKGIRVLPSFGYPDDYQFEVILPRSSIFTTLGYTDIESIDAVFDLSIIKNKGLKEKKYSEEKTLDIRFVLLKQSDPILKMRKGLFNMATGEEYPQNTYIFNEK